MKEFQVILRPLSEEEMQLLSLEMIKFFSVMNNSEMRSLLSLPPVDKVMHPLSLFDFINYLEKTKIKDDALAYMYHIMPLARKLSDQGILIPAGSSKGAPGLNACYYSMKPLTSVQENANYWLASVLGERYLRSLLDKYIVRIEGENDKGKWGTGSGILIAADTILTCAHNICDMQINSCWIGETSLEITSMQTHEKYDVGIIKVSPICETDNYPYFGPPLVLDRILTLGYPPLRGMRGAQLLAQSGEINAIGAETFTGCECITISSITRPGNSGGPVFSMQGYIVGIVISSASSVDTFTATGDSDKQSEKSVHQEESPFYLAISSNALREIVVEIDPTVEIRFEQFQ